MIYEKITLEVPYEKGNVKPDGCEAVLTAIVPNSLPRNERIGKLPAVIICPGGGYDYCSVREAEPIATRFASYDCAAFVLNYSCYQKLFPTNLLELAAAFLYVKSNAEKYNVDTDKIYVCGFSAGGHLAGSLAVFWNRDFVRKPFGAKGSELMPAGAILSYPVITSGEKRHDGSIRNIAAEDKALIELVSLEKQVDADTVPVFIWHTSDDELVPIENTIDFTSALAGSKVPFECHIFRSGVHGLALCDRSTANYDGHLNSDCAQWFELALRWMENPRAKSK